MNKIRFVGAALLIGMTGCSVHADIDSKVTPQTKTTNPYQIHRISKDDLYEVVEIRGGGKVYLVLRHGYLSEGSMVKLDERHVNTRYSDRVRGY